MEIFETGIKGLMLIKPRVFPDDRGYFFESFNQEKFPEDLRHQWVQDNESKSTKGVLRGLHYQVGEYAQAKLVRAVFGSIYDVVVDIRKDSETYGKWYGVELTEENKLQLLIPRGFAHGFLVLSEEAIFSYKCDNFYNKESEGGILYNDPNLKVEWPKSEIEVQLSEKDKNQPLFGDHKPFE
jgi:dTDP-4-dehydrorhamnose 3,5-epimerase